MAHDTIQGGRRGMAAVLRAVGAALLLIGLAGYLLPAGPVHWTALIPAALGAVALGASLLRPGPVAVAVGVAVCALALFGGGTALAQVPALLAGEAGAATAFRAATAVVALAGLAGIAFAARRPARVA
ncbi:hypothetical protein [Falsiroseomonas sp. CW058]|uniref:hypothetical protein n=1 Tax=Falsiroseomonas sp. CW058 TaxID=3388664 RepID=UPI003D322669